MSSYIRKNGTVIETKTVYNKAMNKRGISKIVHAIPARPYFKSPDFAKTLVAYFGQDFIIAVQARMKARNKQ